MLYSGFLHQYIGISFAVSFFIMYNHCHKICCYWLLHIILFFRNDQDCSGLCNVPLCLLIFQETFQAQIFKNSEIWNVHIDLNEASGPWDFSRRVGMKLLRRLSSSDPREPPSCIFLFKATWLGFLAYKKPLYSVQLKG